MSMHKTLVNQSGNNVLAEVAVRIWICCILIQGVIQEIGIEYINTHGCQGHIRIAGHGCRILGLLYEFGNEVVLIDLHHTQSISLRFRNRNTGYGYGRSHADVVHDQRRIIHLVNMIACQNQNIFRVVIPDNVNILINSVGRALIPVFLIHSLLSG